MGWVYHFSGIKEIAVQLANEKAKYGKTVLFVVGEGDAYEDLVTIKNMHHLDTQLVLAGKQPYAMIPEFIAAADICILPAYPDEKIMQDIVPIKIFEYMAVGKPVISTKLSGIIKEFGFNNGVIYVDTPEETLTAADELVKADMLHEMGMKSRAFVEPKDWARITDCFEKCLEDTIHFP